MRDGIDDYALVRIDLNGDGEITGDPTVAGGPDGPIDDEILVNDPTWTSFQGVGNGDGTEAAFDVTNVAAGGEWRDIEVFVGTDGWANSALYMTRDSSPDSDNWPNRIDGFTPELQAEYLISNDILRFVRPGEVVSGTSTAELDSAFAYIVEVNSELIRSDLISVFDREEKPLRGWMYRARRFKSLRTANSRQVTSGSSSVPMN